MLAFIAFERSKDSDKSSQMQSMISAITGHKHKLGYIGYLQTSGKFRHTFANSGNLDESYQDFYCLLS